MTLKAISQPGKDAFCSQADTSTSTYPCQLSLGQLSLGFAPLASRHARDAALGANASETLTAPGTLKKREEKSQHNTLAQQIV